MRKDVALPDRIEAGVPSIWKGIRTLFNFKEVEPQEAVAAVPASYQTVISTPAIEFPEMPCKHPTLGLAGTRFVGSQFFATLQYAAPDAASGSGGDLVVPGSTTAVWFSVASDTAVGGFPLAGIPINPLNFGNQLARRAVLYDRYRFNFIRFRFVSTCGVSTTGTISAGYYKDYASGYDNLVSTNNMNFGRVVDLVPSIMFPQNVAQASLLIPYEGPELYYCGYKAGRPWGPTEEAAPPYTYGDAQNRQEQQGLVVLALDSVSPTDALINTMNVLIDYDIELYDPIPEGSLVPRSVEEVGLVQRVLMDARSLPGRVQKPKPVLLRPQDPGLSLIDRLLRKFEDPDPVPNPPVLARDPPREAVSRPLCTCCPLTPG